MRTITIVHRLGILFASLYVACGFALFLSVADNYYKKTGTLPIPPTISAVLFLVSIIGFALLRDFLYRRPTFKISALIKSNLAVISPFAFLAFLSLALALHPGSFWCNGRKWIYLQTYDFCIFFGAMLLPTLDFVRNRYRVFVIVSLAAILGSIWYDVQNPGTFSTVPGRAAGFPCNSNWGALATVMICSCALSYREGSARIVDLIILALTGLGIYFTLSRSGTVNFVILVLFYTAITFLSSKDRVRTTFTMIGSLAGLLTFFVLVVPLASKNSALMESSSKSQNRLLALFEGEVKDDGSAEDRMEAARDTLNRIEASPIIGNGTGFNRRLRQTPHNLYLKLWVDSGVLGLGTWLTLLTSGMWLFTVRKYRPGQALILCTIFGGFFSHNILEQRTFLFLFGAGACVSLLESAEYVKRVRALVELKALQARSHAEKDQAAKVVIVPATTALG